MADELPNFAVYWRRIGKRKWKGSGAFSLEEASRFFHLHDDEAHEVLIYENKVEIGHEGSRHEGSVLFWWSKNHEVVLECEPTGRGTGWSDDLDCFVHYTSTNAKIGLNDEDREAHAALKVEDDDDEDLEARPAVRWAPQGDLPERRSHDDGERFAEVECACCGRILPQNRAIVDELEVRTGRSSGTRSFSASASSRTGHSSRGYSFSNTNRASARTTSGRNYYSVQQAYFCSEQCRYKAQRETVGDKPTLDQLAFFGVEFIRRLTRG